MMGILYFSSTGNSLYIAEKIKQKTGGRIIYIPTYTGDGAGFDRLIIVTPVYSFGMPIHVYDMLPRLDKNTELVIVQNYGGMIGGADYFIYKYAAENGLNIKSVYTLKMPENFTLTFTVPKFYMQSALKHADKHINKVINDIISGKNHIPRKKKTKENVYLKNKSNWHIIGERFSVTDACIRCGKCVSVCPVGNISLDRDGIKFGDKCVACIGCYHRCPQKAIIYLGKTKKDRYVNPNIDEQKIGKDIE